MFIETPTALLWSSIVLSVCFVLIHDSSSFSLCESSKYKNQNTKCNQIRKRNEMRWGKSKTIAENPINPLWTSFHRLLTLSISVSAVCSNKAKHMEAAAKVALPLSLSHSLISDSKQRQLVICRNMLADLLCLPDNQRSFTVFIFSLLLWKLNELTDWVINWWITWHNICV